MAESHSQPVMRGLDPRILLPVEKDGRIKSGHDEPLELTRRSIGP
jgi:hypothetical protein